MGVGGGSLLTPFLVTVMGVVAPTVVPIVVGTDLTLRPPHECGVGVAS